MTKSKNKNSKKAVQVKRKKPSPPAHVSRPQQKPMSIGAQIGDSIQKLGVSLFKRITGMGDYRMPDNMRSIQKNDLISGNTQVPMRFGEKNTFIFEHSEYVTDIFSSSTVGAFSASAFTVNPSNTTLFPWLSALAGNFETYEILGLIAELKSTSSIVSTTPNLGSLIGAYYYDTLDPTPLGKANMLQYEGSVDARITDNVLIGVECAKGSVPLNKLYNGPVPAGADAKMYNHGTFVFATQGVQTASQNVGEFWLHYKIRFYIAKTTLDAPLSLHVAGIGGGTLYPVGVISAITGNITTPNTVGQNPSTLTMTNLIPGQKYVVTHILIGSSTTTATVNAPTITGASLVNLMSSDSIGWQGSYGGTGVTNSWTVAYILCTSSTVTFASGWTTVPSSNKSDLFVSPLGSVITV